MGKILFLITCLVLTVSTLSESLSLNCEYDTDYHYLFGHLYSCKVTNNPNIETPESTFIESITGKHRKKRNDDSVTTFAARLKTINYFPKNLETFFKNLKIVQIESCHLKEIHQSDLKGLKKLQSLDLTDNDLQIIEQDLFKRNLELEYIDLYENKLFHIDPDVFENLPKLQKLTLIDSGCSFPVVEYRTITSVIKEAKDRCVNFEHLTTEGKTKYSAYQEHKKQQELDFSSRQNTITCEFKKKLGTIYSSFTFWCEVKYNLTITTPELAQITSAFEITDKYEAVELPDRNDIVRFEVRNQLINYFPKGLEKFFTSLKQISINSCQMKEIHQADLKPLQKLTYINLNNNLIRVIDDDLFDFNKELSEIYLSENKIVHIGNDAFSRVPRLETLYLLGIPCLDQSSIKGARDSYGVKHAIDIVRRNCYNPNQ